VHARPNLEQSTRVRYAQVWDNHVLPRLGMYQLRELTPEVVFNFRADLDEADVGAATARKALFLLQSIMALAVVRGRVPNNPVRAVRKPRQASRRVRPFAPQTVEAIRAALGPRDATLVAVLAYAGLRPGEALALTWEQVGKRTISVVASISFGREKGTKTNATRTVRLLRPLSRDLAEWHLACGRPGVAKLVFPRSDGRAWTDSDYRNWRKRVFQPAARSAGVGDPRPYDLRHSFVSLLIHEGVSIMEVARQAGHSTQECLKTYAHTFDEFDPAERTPAEAAIRAARAEALYAKRTREPGQEPVFSALLLFPWVSDCV
jgi:integrase